MRKRRNRINIQLGVRLRQIREKRGLSQVIVAKWLGILRTSLVNIEYGRQNVTVDMLMRLAGIYGVTAGELLDSQP